MGSARREPLQDARRQGWRMNRGDRGGAEGPRGGVSLTLTALLITLVVGDAIFHWIGD